MLPEWFFVTDTILDYDDGRLLLVDARRNLLRGSSRVNRLVSADNVVES